MIRLRVRYARRRDDGVAMLFVIAIGLVVSGFMVAMLASVLQTQKTTRLHRNVTSALGAAEAGLDDMIYKLGQTTGTPPTANWATYPTSYPSTSTALSQAFGPGASVKTWITKEIVGGSQTGRLIIWSKGTYGANTRTVRATVMQTSPPAFMYSMFASKGIDIHNHGSTYLSPLIRTTSVHSNGYIKIAYPSSFTVNSIEAVSSLTFESGGGKNYGGSVTAPYSWYDPFNGLCFPGMYQPTSAPTCNGVGTKDGKPYSSTEYQYSQNAQIRGTLSANSVTLASHGQVLQVPANTYTDSGQLLDGGGLTNGNILAAAASINGSSYTPASQNCTQCNQGSAATAGQVAGSLQLSSGYAPPVVPFPTMDYTYSSNKAAAEGANHIFTSGGNFLSTITNPANGYLQNVAANGTMTTWHSGDPAPAAIFLDGDWIVNGGSLQLNFTSVKGMVNANTGTSGPAPIIVVRGSLVVPSGGISLQSPLAVVGPGNENDFIVPGSSTQPVSVNLAKFLDANAIGPGFLAAGGSIDSSDYDTDAPWTAACGCYEPTKANPVYIRGLVYSATYDPTTQTSVPQNQHFHNSDPKNLQVLYGAQVGADLHDCNNFQFTYDPIVQKAYGFGGGNVQVVDYQELGS